jgi:hypothetical protein
MVPKSIILSQVNQVKTLGLWLALVCLVLGSIACYYLANRNYKPVLGLIQTVSELFDQGQQLKQTIHHYIPVIRADFLNRLIRGRINSTSLSRH